MHNLATSTPELLDNMSPKKIKDMNSFKKFGICDYIDNKKTAFVGKLFEKTFKSF